MPGKEVAFDCAGAHVASVSTIYEIFTFPRPFYGSKLTPDVCFRLSVRDHGLGSDRI